MAFEYKVTICDLAPSDLDQFSTDNITTPVPIPPAGAGWSLVSTSTGDTKIYFTWVRGSGAITTTSSMTLSTGDDIVFADASSGSLVITLFAATNGGKITIKKIDNTNNTVSVQAVNGETIDGNTSQVISVPMNSLNMMSNGTVWYLV